MFSQQVAVSRPSARISHHHVTIIASISAQSVQSPVALAARTSSAPHNLLLLPHNFRIRVGARQSRRLLLARWIFTLATSRAAMRIASLTSLACGLLAERSMKSTNLSNATAVSHARRLAPLRIPRAAGSAG